MTDLTDFDRDALTLAIEVTRRESPASLRLPPWQPSPYFVGDMTAALANTDEERLSRSGAVAATHGALGVSRWHPDPARECDRLEGARRATAK